MKLCKGCLETLPAESFGKKRDGTKAKCRSCEKPDRKRYRRAERLKTRYGITPADYDRMLAEQGGGCAVCGAVTDPVEPNRSLAVDHCHATGKVRGVLCTVCNRTIGKFNDDPAVFERFAAYLRRATAS